MAHIHNHTGKNEALTLGYKATAISALSDLGLAGLKFIAGTLGQSSALIADAVHSLTDLGTDFVSFVSLRISHEGPDEDHPYGHGRAETIGTAVIGLVVVAVGVGLAWDQVAALGQGEHGHPTWLAMAAAAFSLALKEFMFFYTLAIGKKARSESVIANAWHHRSDSLSSLAALIGIGGAVMGYHVMDPLAAIVVGVMIVHMGVKITREAVGNLMDSGLSQTELKEIRAIIDGVPGVVHHHDIKTRKAGRDVFVDVHIQVPPRISVSEAHNTAETVRNQLRRMAPYLTDAMVHIDAEDDSEGTRLYADGRAQVEKVVIESLAQTPGLKLAEDITIHYFAHRLAADITLDGAENLSVADARKTAVEIRDRLFANGVVAEVNIKHNLGQWKKPDGQAAG